VRLTMCRPGGRDRCPAAGNCALCRFGGADPAIVVLELALQEEVRLGGREGS
jgi:hypothetical protein